MKLVWAPRHSASAGVSQNDVPLPARARQPKLHTSSARCPHRGEDKPHQATASQSAQALDTKGANLCLLSCVYTLNAAGFYRQRELVFTARTPGRSSLPSIRQVFTANWSWSLPLAPRAGLHRPQSGRFLPPCTSGRSSPPSISTRGWFSPPCTLLCFNE